MDKSCGYAVYKTRAITQLLRGLVGRKVRKSAAKYTHIPTGTETSFQCLAFHFNILLHLLKFPFLFRGPRQLTVFPVKQVDTFSLLFAFRQSASGEENQVDFVFSGETEMHVEFRVCLHSSKLDYSNEAYFPCVH